MAAFIHCLQLFEGNSMQSLLSPKYAALKWLLFKNETFYFVYRRVFRAHSNVYDETFLQK